MSQYNPKAFVDTESGTQLVQRLNSAFAAVLSGHKGASPPTYAEAGTAWIDDSATPWLLKRYDGSDWIVEGAIDPTTNAFSPYKDGVPLGSMAEQDVDDVAITGGSIAGIDPLAVADGGTGANDAAGARSNLGLVIGTNVLAPNGDGSQLTGIDVTPVDAVARANTLLNAFRLMSASALALQQMVDGFADEFVDTTGIATEISVTHLDEAYIPGVMATEIDEECLNYSAGGGNGYTWRSVIPASKLTTGGNKIRVRLKAYLANAASIDNVAIVERSSGADGVTTPTEITFQGGESGVDIPAESPGATVWSDWIDFTVDPAKDYLVIVDYADAGTPYPAKLNGATGYTTYTKSGNSYDTAAMPAGYSTQSDTLGCVEALEVIDYSDPSAIESITASADADPDEIEGYLLIDPAGTSPDLNTDIVMKVSRDDGTTWATISLAQELVNSSGILVSGAGDVSGQPAGSDVRYRVEWAAGVVASAEAAGVLWN